MPRGAEGSFQFRVSSFELYNQYRLNSAERVERSSKLETYLGVSMPLYEFLCENCDKTFSKVLTLAEYDKDGITCPYCGSKKVVQEPSAFFAVTSKKS